MLTISIRDASKNKSIELYVNEEQKISDTLAVLKEAAVFNLNDTSFIIHSVRTGKRINPSDSYRGNNLYNGDILNIEYTKDKSQETERTKCRQSI